MQVTQCSNEKIICSNQHRVKEKSREIEDANALKTSIDTEDMCEVMQQGNVKNSKAGNSTESLEDSQCSINRFNYYVWLHLENACTLKGLNRCGFVECL